VLSAVVGTIAIALSIAVRSTAEELVGSEASTKSFVGSIAIEPFVTPSKRVGATGSESDFSLL
jgi:hypothetical protein